MIEIPLKEFLEARIEAIKSLLDERDRLYNARFEASGVAVNAALAAQEKAVTAAFLASEKAIVKAEEAQKDYNIRSNEFRGQLDDQAKTLMPRLETLAMFEATVEKIDVNQKQIDDLRLSKATLEGKASQESVNRAFIISVIGIVMAIISIAIKFLPL